MTDVLGIIVAGADGRMGKQIIQLLANDAALKLAGATESQASAALGQDAGTNAGTRALNANITADLASTLKGGKNVIIDFSHHSSTLANLALAVQNKTPMVIGTTGFDAAETAKIQAAALKIPIMQAPNMSIGVNVMLKLVAEAAKILDQDYDIEILEAHHKLKKDAPSGTALKLAEVICAATGRNFPGDLKTGRNGITGERTKKEIGMQVIRGGDIVGDHTVFYCGEGERLEVRHVATSRATFAGGALHAAKWLSNKPAGLYNMQNVLGLD
jgi:4-hydroxy-tetrahydrodipicolinate reductase